MKSRALVSAVLACFVTGSVAAQDPAPPPATSPPADSLPPGDVIESYNQGTALYSDGEFNVAEPLLRGALASTGPRWVGRIAYNLGNTHFRQAQAAEQRSAEQAAALYQKALEDYRTAMRQDPRDMDAIFNYELTQRKLAQAQAESQAQEQASDQPQSGEGQSQSEQSGSEAQEQAQAGEASQNASPSQGQAVQEQQAQQSGSESAQAEQRPGGQTEPSDSGQPREPQGTASGAPLRAVQDPVGSGSGQDGQPLSKTEALWVLDALRQEEQGALGRPRQDGRGEADVERDW